MAKQPRCNELSKQRLGNCVTQILSKVLRDQTAINVETKDILQENIRILALQVLLKPPFTLLQANLITIQALSQTSVTFLSTAKLTPSQTISAETRILSKLWQTLI